MEGKIMSIKTELSVGFVSLARPGFDMDYAKMAAEKSFQQIKKFAKVVAPEGYLVGDNKGTQMALELFKREKTDLLVIQCGTFTSAEIVLDWVSQLGIPVVTVSYTHLRAHETRHDLVCRLLLEKKNKKLCPKAR